MTYKVESVPSTGTKIITTDYTGEKCLYTFKCPSCGHDKYYRHKKLYKHGFYTGSFVCRACKKEFDYTDNAFKSEYIKKFNSTDMDNELTIFENTFKNLVSQIYLESYVNQNLDMVDILHQFQIIKDMFTKLYNYRESLIERCQKETAKRYDAEGKMKELEKSLKFEMALSKDLSTATETIATLEAKLKSAQEAKRIMELAEQQTVTQTYSVEELAELAECSDMDVEQLETYSSYQCLVITKGNVPLNFSLCVSRLQNQLKRL